MLMVPQKIKKTPKKKIFFIFLCSAFILFFLYVTFFNTLSTGPLTEQKNMDLLEDTKKEYEISDFSTDGCSGNISKYWKFGIEIAIKTLPDQFEAYKDVKDIPFESACKVHDRAYYQGVGGYEGRLKADNALRYNILQYAFENIDEIKQRTGLESDASVLFMYEVVADTIYRGVRLGGMPCTGMPYAWGYGYNEGSCVEK